MTNYLLIFLFLIIIIGYLFFLFIKSKKENNKLKTKYDSCSNEIKNHYLNLNKINQELKQLSVIINETENAVSVMDSKGDYQWINDGFTRLYGYSLEELRLEQGRRRIGSNSNLKVKDLINIWFGEKKPILYESQNLTKNGEKIWIQTTLTPVLNSEDKVEELIAIDANISKIKEAEEIILKKNENITDSIEYAKRIQQAILPPFKFIDNVSPQNFLIYLPKEIISGDFYWTTNINGYTIVAVADCTGHGVPGAFMSMLGITLLNKIVNERAITDPANILNRLRIDVINALRQTGKDEETKDGMDISLIKINENRTKIIYAGAMNSSYIIRNKSLIELKADTMPIGIHYNSKMPFSQYEIDIKKDDTIFMLTDGYPDQFGGKNYKKFKLQKLKELFVEINEKDMNEQKNIILETHNKWKGREEQIDDILMLGLKI